MVNKDDIIALARAGFSAAQIAALAAAPQPVQQQVQQQVQQPVQQQVQQQVQQPVQQQVQQQVSNDPVAQMLAKVGALTDAIQASAILGSNQPKQETADDILAAIIAPPMLGDNNTK